MMRGTIIRVRGGDGAPGLLDELGRLIESRGAGVEVVQGSGSSGLAGEGAIPACLALARHGVTVVTSCEVPAGDGVVDLDAADISDPARLDAFLRRLELAGMIPPPDEGPEEAEEELIRKRLEDLGYL